MFDRTDVIAAINKEEHRLAAAIDVSIAEVIRELRRYAFVDDDDALVANNAERIRALELLGKHKAMFKDVLQNDVDRAPRPETKEEIIANSEARRLQFKLSNNNKTEPSN